MRLSKTILGLSVAVLSLTACKSLMDPTFIPSGYTYHRGEYKSPPADKPWSIGYDYLREDNAQVLEAWQLVVADLVDKLEASADLGTQPVFLASPELDNAFTLSLDNALREELRSRGYILAAVPFDDTLKLSTVSYDPAFKDVMRSYDLNDQEEGNPEPPKPVSKNLVLQVNALLDGAPVTLVEEEYELPLYGYEDKQLYFPLTQSIAEVWR